MHLIQATTGLVDTVLVETTVLVEEKSLTTQFYLLTRELPGDALVILSFTDIPTSREAAWSSTTQFST